MIYVECSKTLGAFLSGFKWVEFDNFDLLGVLSKQLGTSLTGDICGSSTFVPGWLRHVFDTLDNVRWSGSLARCESAPPLLVSGPFAGWGTWPVAYQPPFLKRNLCFTRKL